MTMRSFIGLVSVLGVGALTLPAQDLKPIDQLQDQIRRLQQDFDRVQQEHRRQLQQLQEQLDALRGTAPAPAPTTPVPSPGSPATNTVGVLPSSSTPQLPNSETPQLSNASPGWSPTDNIRLGSGRAFVDVSMAAAFAAGSSTESDVPSLQLGGHDPNQRGFTLQGMDLTLAGAVDPYFTGQATVVYMIDAEGESAVEIEEGYLQSSSLPGNLQLKAGQYFTEFGRLNTQHPESWAFVDEPVVNARFLGPDGLRNPGARVSWLAPTPFYSEVFLGVQNSQGETAHSFRNANEGEPLFGRPWTDPETTSAEDMLYAPRLAMSFDLTENQTLLMGASGAFGPNGSGAGHDTQIYGADVFWKWKPALSKGGYPFVSWQTEAMLRHYDAAAYAEDTDNDGVLDIDLPGERLVDYGFYSQVSWGFRKGWILGLRGDWIEGDEGAYTPDPDREGRWRVSPALTWHPTEFSRFRLQYNYDDRAQAGTDHSVWLQWVFILGAHPAHNY